MTKQRVICVFTFLAIMLFSSLKMAYAARENEDGAPSMSRRIEGDIASPRTIQITPSTNSIAHAMYYHSVAQRIDKFGTERFPKEGKEPLYGSLTIWIPISRDGSIYESEGGPKVDRSSGNESLDMAALEIVRTAAPFGRFPSPYGKEAEAEVWELLLTFDFKKEDVLNNLPVNGDAESAPR